MSQAPVGLIILDGWGVRGEAAFNAPALARTPHFDAMMARFPTARLAASGVDVGLPEGQIGNSEVGHLNIGSGRVVMQTLPRITAAFASGEAAENRAILDFVAEAKAGTGRVHLLGLLSPVGFTRIRTIWANSPACSAGTGWTCGCTPSPMAGTCRRPPCPTICRPSAGPTRA